MSDDWVNERYTGAAYHEDNPTWDAEDSPWKARLIERLLVDHGLRPSAVAEIGCGAGAVLAHLRSSLPEAELYGFDIAPALEVFWAQQRESRITFALGDFLAINRRRYDVILVLDVIEHLANPFEFLPRIRPAADHFVFHIPLDLSASSVVRETPLLAVRRQVGHLHFYTKTLALTLLAESGYRIVDWRYTGAAFTAPQRSWTTRGTGLLRRLAYAANKDLGVRVLGGETLLVLAQPAAGVD